MSTHTLRNIISLFIIVSAASYNAYSQEYKLKSSYIGILPSVLFEPYDTIEAIEVNIVPFVYEYKFNRETGIQFRSIVNYRFYKLRNGISQIGGTLLINKYLTSLFKEDFFIIPVISGFCTYTFNQIDKINTSTVGIEPGVMFKVSNSFTINLNLQPGINYYHGSFSRKFIGTKSGFKPHFGVIFHMGYHF